MNKLFLKLLACFIIFQAISVHCYGIAATVFFDSFNTNRADVNRDLWTTPVGDAAFFGRTAIRNPSSTSDEKGQILVTHGTARLVLSTYNPTANSPGDSFWGSEIDSIQNFSLPEEGGGIEFAARVRCPVKPPPGIITSLFAFGLTRGGNSSFKDEIDFEFLSNQYYQSNIIPPKVLINRYVDEPPGRGLPELVGVHNINFTQFNEFAIRWYQNRIVWVVNGKEVRTVTSKIPRGPLSVRLNIWAPGPEFSEAYSPALQPAPTPANNIDYVYEVDWVRVSTVMMSKNNSYTMPAVNLLLLGD